MDIIAENRRRHLVSGETASAIARTLKLSRPTVRKHLRTAAEPVYSRQQQPSPKLGEFQVTLQAGLNIEQHLPKAQRRTARRLYEGLQVEGYRGAYDSVQRFVKQWKSLKNRSTATQAFVRLVFAPGDACQFDRSHEHVEIEACHRRSRSRISAWPTADKCSWRPTREKPRIWCWIRTIAPLRSLPGCRSG